VKPVPPENQTIINRICKKIAGRAADLFTTRQLWCAPALLVSINHGLKGELSDELAIRLSAGLGEGLGGSGCLCGSISGGVLALGLFLGNGRRTPSGDRTVLGASRKLHQMFNEQYGSTCCRVLIKDIKRGSSGHYQLCAEHTATATMITTRMILDLKPDLIQNVDWPYLEKKPNRIVARLKATACGLVPPGNTMLKVKEANRDNL
jgi:C_GCAxxG_C_C family probable redox protein